jgi:hypothetical protein
MEFPLTPEQKRIKKSNDAWVKRKPHQKPPKDHFWKGDKILDLNDKILEKNLDIE